MASLRLVCLFVLALLVLAPSAGAVVDGDPAPESAHDHTVFLGQGLPPRTACTGVLVAPSLVVTAAHCGLVADGSTPSPQPFVVRRGGNFRAPSAQTLGSFFPHPGWTYGGGGLPHFARNDIAVVRLLGAFPGPYASLPAAGAVDALKANTPLDLFGFGISAVHGNDPILASFDGQRRHDSAKLLGAKANDGFFSFLGDSCFGDSGGPLLLAGTANVVGVVSWAPSGCRSTTQAARLDTPSARAFLALHGAPLP